MSNVNRVLCLLVAFCFAGPLIADDSPLVAQVLKTRMVTIEVSIVELAEKPSPEETLDGQSSQDLIARIRTLEKEGQLQGLTRLRLSALEGNQASAQIGGHVAISTGRNAFAGQPGRGGPVVTHTQMQNVGTLVRAITRIEPGDGIVMDLQIEKTSLTRLPRSPNAENTPSEGANGGGQVTTDFKSTVRIPNGQTIVAQASGSSSAFDAPTRTVILVTATADPAPQGDAPPVAESSNDPQLKIFSLEAAKATDMYDLIRELLPNYSISIAVDSRTNTLLVHAVPEHLKIVEGIISFLDKAPTSELRKSPRAAE